MTKDQLKRRIQEVDVASEEGAIDEEMTPKESKKIGMSFENKIKEAILAKLKK